MIRSTSESKQANRNASIPLPMWQTTRYCFVAHLPHTCTWSKKSILSRHFFDQCTAYSHTFQVCFTVFCFAEHSTLVVWKVTASQYDIIYIGACECKHSSACVTAHVLLFRGSPPTHLACSHSYGVLYRVLLCKTLHARCMEGDCFAVRHNLYRCM